MIIDLISHLKFTFLHRLRNFFFSLEILILAWLVEFLENVLPFFLEQDLVYFHVSLAGEWLLFCVFGKESKFFVAEEKSGLHKRELLKYHETFSILVFKGSVSIEMAL